MPPSSCSPFAFLKRAGIITTIYCTLIIFTLYNVTNGIIERDAKVYVLATKISRSVNLDKAFFNAS